VVLGSIRRFQPCTGCQGQVRDDLAAVDVVVAPQHEVCFVATRSNDPHQGVDPWHVVPVDDVADVVLAGIDDRRGGVVTIGCGPTGPTVRGVVEVCLAALSAWRQQRGEPPVDPPPFVPPDVWRRFHFPFIEPHLSPFRLRATQLLEEFHPYFAMASPLAADVVVPDVVPAITRSVLYWAEQRPRAALKETKRWQLA